MADICYATLVALSLTDSAQDSDPFKVRSRTASDWLVTQLFGEEGDHLRSLDTWTQEMRQYFVYFLSRRSAVVLAQALAN